MTRDTLSISVIGFAAFVVVGLVLMPLNLRGNSLQVLVSDKVTGQPVPGTTVRVAGSDGKKEERTTDGQGVALFESVRTGLYRARAENPAYIQREYCKREEPDCWDYVRVTGAGSPIRISIPLSKAGAISGTVVDGDGSPITGAMVMAMGALRGHPNVSLPAMGNLSDDRGRFRIHSVPPGRYFLGVVYSRPRRLQNGSIVRSNVSWYPGGDFTGASLISVGPGSEDEGISLALSFSSGHSISGALTTVPSGGATAVLMQDPAEFPRWYTPLAMSEVSQQGRFHFESIAAGRYLVRIIAQAAAEIQQAVVRVDVGDSDIADLRIDLERLAHFDGSVSWSSKEPGAPNLSALRIELIPKYVDLQGLPRIRLEGSRILVEGLFSGDYRLRVNGLPAGWYVASSTYSSSGWQHVEASNPPQMLLSLATGAAAVEGVVRRGTDPAPQATVIVMDKDGEYVLEQFRTTDEGAFSNGQLAPGEYKVAAFDTEDIDAYLTPRNRSQLLSRAVSIRIERNSKSAMEVPLILKDAAILGQYPSLAKISD